MIFRDKRRNKSKLFGKTISELGSNPRCNLLYVKIKNYEGQIRYSIVQRKVVHYFKIKNKKYEQLLRIKKEYGEIPEKARNTHLHSPCAKTRLLIAKYRKV